MTRRIELSAQVDVDRWNAGKCLEPRIELTMDMVAKHSVRRDRRELNDRRWVVLGTDGRYVTLGRATDPTESEIRRAEEALRAQGFAGWLAIMSGSAYAKRIPHFMMVRPLAEPRVTFDEAVEAFRCHND